MDYIREELLRQRNLLSVLMTGRQQEQSEESERRESSMAIGRQVHDLREERSRSAEENIGTALRRRSQLERSGSLSMESRVSSIHSEREASRHRAETLVREDLAVPVRAALYERMAPETSVGVREVSRSIQQDARRYDGGFSIY